MSYIIPFPFCFSYSVSNPFDYHQLQEPEEGKKKIKLIKSELQVEEHVKEYRVCNKRIILQHFRKQNNTRVSFLFNLARNSSHIIYLRAMVPAQATLPTCIRDLLGVLPSSFAFHVWFLSA